LVSHREKPHPRESLAHLLWNDSTTSQSKKYLRQILWRLRAGLSVRGAPQTRSLLRIDTRWVQLATDERTWLDVAEIEKACAPGTAATHSPDLLAAIQLYGGDLLEGWYQDWCLRERERFRQMYLGLLDRMVALHDSNGDSDAAIAYATLALRADPSREYAHRALMKMFYQIGNRAAARSQYERCVVALREELGAPPEDQTRALFERIMSGRSPEARRR
jgi:DNA-binding SARP family transcriptional activator